MIDSFTNNSLNFVHTTQYLLFNYLPLYSFKIVISESKLIYYCLIFYESRDLLIC